MKIQVKLAVDIELNNNEELESKKKDLRKRIKTARRLIMMEANQWEKQLLKCEEKSKAGKLTGSSRNHLKTLSEMSQDTLLRQTAVVTEALEELLMMGGELS